MKVKCLNDNHIDVQKGQIYEARILKVGEQKIPMLAVIDDDEEEFFYDFADFEIVEE